MKLLWLCNMMPGAVLAHITGQAASGGLWVDHVLKLLRTQDVRLHILFPGEGQQGALDENCSFLSFHKGAPHVYVPDQETLFRREVEVFQPDVIHIWGTEFGHTLAMMKVAESLGLLERCIISIQGLCSVYAGHYAEGVPHSVQQGYTFRDLIRRDNIRGQREKFILRGQFEEQALKMTHHVMGRTQWDRACTARLNPDVRYHFCNETLREPFYQDQWRYDACRKHRIFASSCLYPIKGFHYLLEAFREVLKTYPDATLAVPGTSFFEASKLRRTNYQKYMAELAAGLEDKIEFLGSLSAQQMKAAYLSANVFVLPSTIENSPNSLGEAMLLGLPCVSSDVGGVKDLMTHGEEGILYQSSASYMLAYEIMRVFAMEEKAETMGRAAHAHAAKTHAPQKNLEDLMEIYRSL